MTANVLLFGATGRTGAYIAAMLIGRGDAVTAVVRKGADTAALETPGISLLPGNPVESETIEQAFAAGPFDAVISTLGHRRGEPGPRADKAGVELIVKAATEHGPKRMLMVTMIGAGDSIGAVSDKVIEFLSEAIEAKTAAETMLADSGLDFTILRPGGLNGDPDAGTGVKTTDHNVMGVIAAGDLARLVIECMDDDTTIGQIYHTIDPEIEQQAPLQRGEDLPPKK